MIKTISHNVLSSFKVYLDYKIGTKLQAFKNKTTTLYRYVDPSISNKVCYGSPFAQWVYNQSVSGANIANGIIGSPSISRGTSGLVVDYKNGRFLADSSVTGIYTANISVQEINSYISTLPDEKLLAQTNFTAIPDLKPASTYLPPRQLVLPAVFIRLLSKENDPAMFGGMQWTDFTIKLTCIMTSVDNLVAIQDLIADLERSIVPILDNSPLNEYNDLKDPSWNYSSSLSNPSSYFSIENANIRFTENDEFSEKNNTLHVGIGTLRCRVLRLVD